MNEVRPNCDTKKTKLPKYEIRVYYAIFFCSVFYICNYARLNNDYCLLISLFSVTMFDRAFYVIIHDILIQTARLINTKWIPYVYIFESTLLLYVMSYKMLRIVTIHCFLNFSLVLLGHKKLLWFCNFFLIFFYPYYDESMSFWSRFRQSLYLIFYVIYLTKSTRSLSSGIDTARAIHKDMIHPVVLKFHFWQTIDFGVKLMLFYGMAAHSPSHKKSTVQDVPGSVFRITRMSYIWRRLDEQSQSFRMRGLVGHVFFRTLRMLVVKVFNQYVATIFSFIYTLLWYGFKKNLTWSVLSYFEYKIEWVVRFIGNTDVYKSEVKGKMSAITERRLQAVLSVPLAFLVLFTNMFLLNAAEMQDIFWRFSTGWLLINCCVMYCWCQLIYEIPVGAFGEKNKLLYFELMK